MYTIWDVASENSIQLTRGYRRITTCSPNDCDRPPFRAPAARLLQAAGEAGSRNLGLAALAQCPPTARSTSVAFALGRSCPFHLALSSVPPRGTLTSFMVYERPGGCVAPLTRRFLVSMSRHMIRRGIKGIPFPPDGCCSLYRRRPTVTQRFVWGSTRPRKEQPCDHRAARDELAIAGLRYRGSAQKHALARRLEDGLRNPDCVSNPIRSCRMRWPHAGAGSV
jgi:hypothetical protein